MTDPLQDGFDWPLDAPADVPGEAPPEDLADEELTGDPRSRATRRAKSGRGRTTATTAETPDPGAPDPGDDAAWFSTVAATAGPDVAVRALPVPRAAPVGAPGLAETIVARMNPEQARAVTTTEGPLLILAGAGSGKTRVLAHRVAYLVGVRGVRPWQILAVTFTNKAAAEMRARILALVGEGGREVAMGTFHSLCARVLRRDGAAIGIDPRFTIYDTDDQTNLMKQVLRDLEVAGTGELRPSAMLGAIGRWKNEMITPDEAAAQVHTYHEQIAARAYARYAQRLRDAAALDFDDLLLEAVRLFAEAPGVLTHYQERWRYLHVDEYQDTNRAQYLFVRHLAARHRNLAVVGDDDQSIYSWRGADISNILDFERDYPDATVVKLEQNYRSTQLILDAAHAVVSRNESRKDKKLWTENPRGVLIERFEADREDEEAEWITRQVEALVGGRGAGGSMLARRADEGDDREYRLRDIAIMYRTNAQSRAIEEAFLRYGLRYQLVGGTRFYQRREVKDALAYLRILRNDHDVAAFERVLNLPARGIGEKTLLAVRA
nr:UvrD-helicase domain-containing protein [Chloroflexota bacterium]